jgi:hypothetical protein
MRVLSILLSCLCVCTQNRDEPVHCLIPCGQWPPVRWHKCALGHRLISPRCGGVVAREATAI